MFQYFTRQKYIIFVLAFLTTFAAYLISPIEVRFLSGLSQNTFLIGLTYAIGSVTFSIISVYLGHLSDKTGRNKFVVYGMGLGIIYPIFYAFVINIYQYMGIRLAWAFSAVSTGPIFMAYIQDMLKNDKDKAQFMGNLYAIQSIAGSLAMYIGGLVSDLYGLKAPYFLMSVLFFLTTGIAHRSIGTRQSITKSFKSRHFLFGLKYVFSKPQLRFYFAINTINTLNYGIKYMLYPLIIFSLTNSNTQTGIIMATQGIVAFIILIYSGIIQKKSDFIPSLL